jgi:hypothetical protein
MANQLSPGRAALVAGVAYLIMSASPLAEALVYNRLVVAGDAATTAQNILTHRALFNTGILLYLINFMGDVLSAWALYILLKPVNAELSLLTAWVKLVYAILSLAAMFPLLQVVDLLRGADYLKAFAPDQLKAQAMLSLQAFREGWSFAYLFFGTHLILVSILAFRSGYIPKVIAACVGIAGLGWLADNLQPYLYPAFAVQVGMVAGFGELIFMFWLLIRGWRVKVA